MENADVEKTVTADEGNQLNRNRSFKTKQLVRSQAIRESTSPPRTVSPSVRSDESNGHVTVTPANRADTGQASDSSHDSDVFSYDENKCGLGGKQRVEIQITSGSWSGAEPEQAWSSRRSRRWPGRDLLSNNPRVACVCGACAACAHCRGRRRRHKCPTKQDSGIVCSEDCPDCSDTEQNGSTNDIKKSASGSIETDEQYCRCSDRKEKPKNISLSRTDSDERSEPLGPELVAFIKETLNKNARDRTTLLRIERELHAFINDPGRCIVKFPVMTSYGRMLVHRCAALFQLAHHLDQSNKTCVIVSKSGTSGGRVPCTSFKSWCVASLPPSPARHAQDQHNAKSILKRDTHSLDEPSSGPSGMSRSKSLEQREREYERVRRRIFSEDDPQWPWLNAGAPVKLLTPEPGRNKLLKVQSLENPSGPPTNSWRGAGAVSKSHSFGGYGDQQPRALSRQGDLASSSWRLSPSSSGYKTLSLRSTDSVTPSPTGGGTPEPAGAGAGGAGGALVWAVTDLAAVPRGVILIHPQTGRPLTNPDGSVYHFDPANPPLLYDPAAHDPQQDQIDQNNEKRRGRLEKQDSFMDNDSECHQSDECRNKSCCGYRKQEQQLQQQQSQQQQTQQHCQQHLQQTEAPVKHVDSTIEKETAKLPPSPIKTYDNPIQNHTAEPTNHSKAADAASNHRTPDAHQPDVTNQRYESQALTNRNYELANQREIAKMMSQDMVHYNTAYAQPYNHEEAYLSQMASQMNPYIQQEMTHIQMGVPQSKVAPLHDPNMRTVSLTNMMYQAGVQQAYSTYIPNHRMEPIPQQMYQPMMQQMEEPKQISSPQQDTTFRIDPSYPFPAVDYACCDPTQLQHHPPPQRSYSVPFGPAEPAQALLPPAYPAPLLLPPVTHYPVQYQEPVQWAPVPSPAAPKLFDVCPVVYQPPYTAYTVPYTQMLPQPYPIYQPVQVEKPEPQPYRKRNSLPPTTRTTPLSHTPDDKKPDEKEPNRQESTEVAAKIQQIKEAMNGVKPRGAEARRGGGAGAEARRDGAWRRNSGHGILGTCPPQYQPQGHPNDESQLSSAARAIINSLRNMQVNNTYQAERRPHENQGYQRGYERGEGYRHRRDRDADKPADRHGNHPMERQDVNGGVSGRGDGDRRFEPRGARGNQGGQVNQPPYRPPYLFRQMSPGTWCRRSPAPVHPNMNHPRRPHPDTRPRR